MDTGYLKVKEPYEEWKKRVESITIASQTSVHTDWLKDLSDGWHHITEVFKDGRRTVRVDGKVVYEGKA